MRAILTTIIIITTILCSCSPKMNKQTTNNRKYSAYYIQVLSGGKFTLSEAIKFHNQKQEKYHINNTIPKNEMTSLGKYEILWDSASYSSDELLHCINVPVKAEYKYKVTREDSRGNKYVVNIDQKLHIYKYKSDGRIFEYIKSYIPDKKYFKKHGVEYGRELCYPEEINGFCGITYTSSTVSGRPILMATYKYGEATMSSFVSENQRNEDYYKIMELLSQIKFDRILEN